MMSRTDKTRPAWVQIADPLNDRYRMMGNVLWSRDGTQEYHWKKIGSCSHHWCSPRKMFHAEKRSQRTKWRTERRKILATPLKDLLK